MKNSIKNSFLNKLESVQSSLIYNNKYRPYSKQDYKECKICNKPDVTKGQFILTNSVMWEDSLSHYVSVHDQQQTDEFTDTIFRYKHKSNNYQVSRLKGTKFTKHNLQQLKIDRNQLLILDSLMIHGSKRHYKDDKKKLFRYSEHAGLLDFNENRLFKVVVYGDTRRVDDDDDDIFLPGELEDAPDYEYIFHTHPATPTPGARAKIGVLYEFPSVGDIFNFIDNHNKGYTQGSCVITPEGLYVIRQTVHSLKKIRIDENKLFKIYNDFVEGVQTDAIDKYGVNFTLNTFYSKISQDKFFINKVNDMLKQFGLKIDFFPRVKDEKNRWILDTVYLPVIPVE